MTDQQEAYMTSLANGAKVVIGGQQAGLFGGPLYISKLFFPAIWRCTHFYFVTIF
jgi:uncharacterized protein YllA (UPF0747 family)